MLTQLYPLPTTERPLEGTYLSHGLRQQRASTDRAFVYANFVTSLDGRIAIPHPTKPGLTVPQQVANPRDWRLFQELAAQADLIISSGRYLRDWAEGRAQEILQVDDPEFADLKAWRLNQGLSPQPDLAVISGSLDFPLPEVLTAGGRNVVVFTTANPDPARVQEIEARAGRVLVAGQARVSGDQLVRQMTDLGYRTVYSAAGPKVLHLLLAGGVLDRLYLTQVNRLLGGDPYAGIVDGGLIEPAYGMKLNTIYLDALGLAGLGQLFVSYDRA
ncbi:MAG: dihydrofolate reductase family protein [Anaerolineae bacterium]|nr:dihydrofolate reductase family protein [Anaerolineae bacterium]